MVCYIFYHFSHFSDILCDEYETTEGRWPVVLKDGNQYINDTHLVVVEIKFSYFKYSI